MTEYRSPPVPPGWKIAIFGLLVSAVCLVANFNGYQPLAMLFGIVVGFQIVTIGAIIGRR